MWTPTSVRLSASGLLDGAPVVTSTKKNAVIHFPRSELWNEVSPATEEHPMVTRGVGVIYGEYPALSGKWPAGTTASRGILRPFQ